jgi:hypothetical protein
MKGEPQRVPLTSHSVSSGIAGVGRVAVHTRLLCSFSEYLYGDGLAVP